MRTRTLTFAEYAALDAINWSTLKEMANSPLHYRHRLCSERPDSDAMAFGRAVHCAVLEPDEFPRRYVLWDGGRRAGKAWEEFCAVNAGREILTAERYDRALAIRDAVRRHPVARGLLRSGRAEQTLLWTDSHTGLRCKARLDWVRPRARTVVDLKTTSDLDPRRFAASAARLLYHGQAAFYLRPLPEWTFSIIAFESDGPHDVAVFELGEDVLWAGDDLATRLLRAVVKCREARHWPGRYPAATELELPGWAFPGEDDLSEPTCGPHSAYMEVF